jgi:hypothetical protein
MGSLEVVDPDGSITVEEHPGRQTVGADDEATGPARARGGQMLPGADAPAVPGGERRDPQALALAPARRLHLPVVGVQIGSRLTQQQVLDQVEGAPQILLQRPPRRFDEQLDQRPVGEDEGQVGHLGREPAVVPVPGLVPEEAVQQGHPADERSHEPDAGIGPRPAPIAVPLQPLEIGAHAVAAPRRIAGDPGDLVPVLVVRIHGDHRVVGRATAQRSRPGIEDTAPLGVVLRVERLAGIVAEVTDEEVPAVLFVFGGLAVEARNLIVVVLGVAPRLEDEHRHPCSSQICC